MGEDSEASSESAGHGHGAIVGRPADQVPLHATLKNDDGDVVDTADEFLERSQQSARELGRALGTELHRWHQVVDGTSFGNFGDSPGSERTYQGWSAYLEDRFLHGDVTIRNVGVYREHRESEPPAALTRDRELLAGFWESYPDKLAEESLMTAQLIQALLQAEHRQDRLHREETDTADVEVTHEFISSLINRMAA